MQKLVLEKIKDMKHYSPKEYLGNTINFLAYCIIDIWTEDIQHYINWALNPDEWYIGMNVADLEKENDYILIGSNLSDQEDGGPFFKISIDEFVKLLPQWKKLVDEGVQEITIIETDDKKILISGK